MLIAATLVFLSVSCAPILWSHLGLASLGAAVSAPSEGPLFIPEEGPGIPKSSPHETEINRSSPQYICLQLQVPYPKMEECLMFFTSIDDESLYVELKQDFILDSKKPGFVAPIADQKPVTDDTTIFGASSETKLQNPGMADNLKLRGGMIQPTRTISSFQMTSPSSFVDPLLAKATKNYAHTTPNELFNTVQKADSKNVLPITNFRSAALFDSIDLVTCSPSEMSSYKKVNAIFQFDITVNLLLIKNKNGDFQTWIIDLKSMHVFVGLGPKPDATVIVSDDDLMDVVTGKINGQMAWIMGKIKVKGSMITATSTYYINLELDGLLRSWTSKKMNL